MKSVAAVITDFVFIKDKGSLFRRKVVLFINLNYFIYYIINNFIIQ